MHDGAVYVFQAQRVWRSTDLIDWTRLEGNTDQLDVFTAEDVSLFSFAGKLWLGGRFKEPFAGNFLPSGRLYSSLDGGTWESVDISFTRLQRTAGEVLAFEGAIYSLSGVGDPYAYRSVANCRDLLGGQAHTADVSDCGTISLSELLRVIQLFSTQGYDCDESTEDGYAAHARSATTKMEGEGEGTRPPCVRHSADYEDPAWRITLPELLRMIQLYNARAYHDCLDSEDGFCLGP